MFDLNLQNFYKIKAIFSLCFLVSSYNIISLGFLKFFMLPMKKRREEKQSVFLSAFFFTNSQNPLMKVSTLIIPEIMLLLKNLL
jgi:hypothetical protein